MDEREMIKDKVREEFWLKRCWCWFWCWCRRCCRHSCDITGAVKMLAGGAAPHGWLLCNGAAVSRTTYLALFNVIGERYGAGDGSATFNLPNLVDRFPRGVAADPGAGAGSDSCALPATNLPSHTHGIAGVTVAPESAHTHGSSYTVSGGSHSHSADLTADEAGEHAHSLTALSQNQGGTPTALAVTDYESFPGLFTGSAGAHSHSVSGTTGSADLSLSIGGNSGAGSEHIHVLSGSTASAGSDSPVEIDTVPAYTALLFIIKM